jgi:3-hydroxyisobutyrate dehydrogenase
MKIGMCGAGRMGGAMALRLLEQGQTVAVWNRTPARAQPLAEAGASTAATPADLMATCELVICMLFDAAAQDAVYKGPDGLLAAPSDVLIVDMSTMTPSTAQALAADVAAAGIAFLTCPVGGTVAPAKNGKLLGMAGGEAAAFDKARPILELLCRRLEHVGSAGAAAAMKLAVNLPLATYWESLGEALSLAIAGGVEAELAGSMMADSSGAIGVAGPRMPMILAAIAEQPDELGAFDVAGMVKDIALMREFAAECGCDVPLADIAHATYSAAAEEGWGPNDAAVMAAWRCRRNAKA